MPGTNYDRFFVESIQGRCRTTDKLTPIIEFLNSQGQDCAPAFKKFMDTYFLSEEERVKVQLQQEKEEAKEITVAGGWTKEELALLTKGIVKFPPGTGDRWATIADFIGSKSQKETIAKAKEIAEKRTRDQDERKEREEAEKEAKAKVQAELAAKAKAEAQAKQQKAAGGKQAAEPKQLKENEGWSVGQQK